MQMVQVELDPGEKVIAEAGAMNYMEEDISFEASDRDGEKVDVDAAYVRHQLGEICEDEDLSRYIL